MAYPLGTTVRCSVLFRATATKLPADPTTVMLSIRSPAGIITQYVYGTDAEVVRDSQGAYHGDIPMGIKGKWFERWNCTGAVVAYSPDTPIEIASSVFAVP